VKDNRGTTTGNGDFGGTDNVEVLKFSLELSVGGFEVNERLLINRAKRVRARSVSGLAWFRASCGSSSSHLTSAYARVRDADRDPPRTQQRKKAPRTHLYLQTHRRRFAGARSSSPNTTPTNPKTTAAPRPRHHALESQRTWPTDSSNAVSAAPFGLTIYHTIKQFVRQSSARVARRKTARMSIADQSPRHARGAIGSRGREILSSPKSTRRDYARRDRVGRQSYEFVVAFGAHLQGRGHLG